MYLAAIKTLSEQTICPWLWSVSVFWVFLNIYSVVGDSSRGRPEGSLFNSYYTEVKGRALLLSLDCSTLDWIRSLYCWVLSKEASSPIFKVFGMMRPGIESSSPETERNPPLQTLQQVCLRGKPWNELGISLKD